MKTNSPTSHRISTGFTLVELLVVIAIIAVLVTIGIGAIYKLRGAADKTVTMGNVRQLQFANASYAADHNGKLNPGVCKQLGGRGVKQSLEGQRGIPRPAPRPKHGI